MARADWRPKERSSVGRLMDRGNIDDSVSKLYISFILGLHTLSVDRTLLVSSQDPSSQNLTTFTNNFFAAPCSMLLSMCRIGL
jgi:hypothetical protein